MGDAAGTTVATSAGWADLLARCRFPHQASASPMLDCALSGGPDSTALVALAAAAGYSVTAWHVNHGIRPEADADEARAKVIAGELGAEFRVHRMVVEPGPHLEARAREARYAALPPQVCTGHTADDRAETVLLNIGRGAGLAGAATRFGRVHRPLMELRRAETVGVCQRLNLVVADDSMNHDTDYARVAIRRVVLPALAEALGRDPVPLLNRHAKLAGEAADVISELAAAVDATDARALSACPPAISSEALRQWLMNVSGSGTPPDAASVDRVLEVAAGHRVATEIGGGHRVARTANRLRFEAAP